MNPPQPAEEPEAPELPPSPASLQESETETEAGPEPEVTESEAEPEPEPLPAGTFAAPRESPQRSGAVSGFDPIAVTTPIRIALALIYFHFGFLKFFPDLSAAEMLATQTILRMRLGIGATDALAYLAVFECLIGLMFALRVPMKYLFPVFIAHMAGTLAPLVLLPQLTFKIAPFAPTLEGQYIMKNAVVIAAGWTLYRAERARDQQGRALERPAPPEIRSATA